MTRLLLDTTFLIDVERDDTGLDLAIADEDDIAIAAVSAAELLLGIELADPRHKDDRQRFVERVLEAVLVVDYDLTVARRHSELLASVRRAGRPRGAHDLIIAATAAATERVVVTADPQGFVDLPNVQVRPH